MMGEIIQLLILISTGWFSGVVINIASDYWVIHNDLIIPNCPNCSVQNISGWKYYLFPLKCAGCSTIKPFRVWIVELVLIITSYLIWYSQSHLFAYLLAMLVFIYFGIVWIIDQELRLIPNILIIVGSILGLIIGISQNELMPTIIGSFAGLIFMLFIYLFGHLFVRLINRWRDLHINEPAMGFGDVLLGGVVGLMVGFPTIVFTLTFTIIAAGLFAMVFMIILLITHRYRIGIAFPYAPFIILSTLYYLYIV